MIKKILILLLTFIFIFNCSSEKEVKNNYNGFALLKFKSLANDGVDDFTFFLFSKNKKFDSEQIPSQSITFPFPQNKSYLDYKVEIKKRGWKEGDLILVKINYSITAKTPLDFAKEGIQYFHYRNRKNEIFNYSFYNLVDNNGDDLFEIKQIEFIRKL